MQFNEVVKELREDTTVKAVIIKSTVAKVFCAGADLKERKSMKDEEASQWCFQNNDILIDLRILGRRFCL